LEVNNEVKDTKRNIKSITFILLVSLIMISTTIGAAAPVVQKNTNNTNISEESASIESLTPYAHIYLYAPNKAKVNKETSIYVSGEIGNIINGYYEKFYIVNTATGKALSTSAYTKVPGNRWKNVAGTWSELNGVVAHTTFSQNWKIKINKAGTYEIVASVVGIGTVPHDQARQLIKVSK